MKTNYLKRILSAGLVATCLVGAFAGCGSKQDTASTPPASDANETTTDGEKINIKIATGASPRPFIYFDDDGNLTGHNYELVNAIFEKLPQYEIEWEATEFTSVFAGLDSNMYQLGVNNFGYSEERAEKYIYTDPYMINSRVFVANKNIELPGDVASYADFAGLTYIGPTSNVQTDSVEHYNEANPDAQIEIVYSDEGVKNQFDMVTSGKYDFFTTDTPMYYGYYEPEFDYDVNIAYVEGLAPDDGALYSYFLVPKGNEQFAEEINAALREVIADGTAKEINLKYFGADYTPYEYLGLEKQ